MVHRADALEKAPQLVRRGAREHHRAVEVVQQPQMFAFVEGVDVVDEQDVALVDDLPVPVDGEHHRRADDDVHRSVLDPRLDVTPLFGRRSAVNLADPDPRPFEPLAEIRHVLANEVARRRQDDDVTARLQNRVDGDAQHHFRLAGTGRRLEEKLEASAVEAGRDRLDRVTLIAGKLESLARLDELVGERDALAIFVDRRPHGGGDEAGCG